MCDILIFLTIFLRWSWRLLCTSWAWQDWEHIWGAVIFSVQHNKFSILDILLYRRNLWLYSNSIVFMGLLHWGLVYVDVYAICGNTSNVQYKSVYPKVKQMENPLVKNKGWLKLGTKRAHKRSLFLKNAAAVLCMCEAQLIELRWVRKINKPACICSAWFSQELTGFTLK